MALEDRITVGVVTRTMPNYGMHPTPLQHVSHDCCVGARVMPGVRHLLSYRDGTNTRNHRRHILYDLLFRGAVVNLSVSSSFRLFPFLAVGRAESEVDSA